MTKHKTEDYKISAVKYYLNNDKGDGYKKTCKIFDCKKSTLRDWIKRYNSSKNLTRKNRKPISYKITKPQVKTALELLKKNEQLTMNELAFDMKQKYPTFDITPQHLGHVIRDNNQTRKRTRHEHFPKERYKKPIDKQTEMNSFYQKIKHKEKSKLTCLKNWGVEHPSQNVEYSYERSKSCYNNKEYLFPSGKLIYIQGYEHYALDFLLKNENINEEEIVVGIKNVPSIWYNDENNKKHRHYVDIFIPSQNRCIEVKSTWTAEKKRDNIFLKQQAAKSLGYKYEIWVYNGKGIIVETYL